MNGQTLFPLTALAAALALQAAGRPMDITLWRGETRTLIAHDAVQLGPDHDGISAKRGVAREIRYRTHPYGTHYAMLADRVEWGSDGTGPVIVSVSVAPDAKPGDYALGDVNVKVIDRVLPPAKDWQFALDLWQHPWAVARYFKVKPFSSAHYRKMRPLWEMLADAGQKALTVTITDRPWNHQCYDAYDTMVRHIRQADGSWKFDYSVLDEYVAFGRSCGIGPQIACYTMCPWEYGVFFEDADGQTRKIKAVPGTPEFNDYWGTFLPDFERHAAEKGWLGDLYIAMDERSPEDVRTICTFIAEKAPRLKTSLAGNRLPSEFKGITIDTYCSSLTHLTDELVNEAAARRAQGMRTTFYVCCGPMYPNTMCHNEINESFWIGAYAGVCGLDGFLRWAWNSWPANPMEDASFATHHGYGWGSGDTYLVYPNGSPSLRFLYLRNGIVAAEKLRILRESGEIDEKEMANLRAQFDRQAAIGNKVNFRAVENATQAFVNRGR